MWSASEREVISLKRRVVCAFDEVRFSSFCIFCKTNRHGSQWMECHRHSKRMVRSGPWAEIFLRAKICRCLRLRLINKKYDSIQNELDRSYFINFFDFDHEIRRRIQNSNESFCIKFLVFSYVTFFHMIFVFRMIHVIKIFIHVDHLYHR